MSTSIPLGARVGRYGSTRGGTTETIDQWKWEVGVFEVVVT
jgi:hypothetical protein